LPVPNSTRDSAPNRRFIKWSGLALSVVLLCLWLVSMQWTCTYMEYGSRPAAYDLRAGTIQIFLMKWNYPPKWLASFPRGWQARRIQWGPYATLSYQLGLILPRIDTLRTSKNMIFPLWIPFVLTSIPTCAIFLNDHRRKNATRGRQQMPLLSRRVRVIFSLMSFALLLIIQIFITETVHSMPMGDLQTGLLLGSLMFTSYLGARAVYLRLGWRWVKEVKLNCASCGYNLTGNVSGVCPECGTQSRNHISILSSPINPVVGRRL
jgi:hypothetical protein